MTPYVIDTIRCDVFNLGSSDSIRTAHVVSTHRDAIVFRAVGVGRRAKNTTGNAIRRIRYVIRNNVTTLTELDVHLRPDVFLPCSEDEGDGGDNAPAG